MGSSIRGTLFNTIHRAIRKTIREINGTVAQLCPYYRFIYSWDERIRQEVFEDLDAGEQKQYFCEISEKKIPLARPLKINGKFGSSVVCVGRKN